MITGIYLLKFTKDLIYIGQSRDVYRRYTTHCTKLKQLAHKNSNMLKAYLEFGLPSLEIIIECNTSELDHCEIQAFEIYKPVLNIAPPGGSFPTAIGEDNANSRYTNAQLISIVEYLADNLDKPIKVCASILGINYSTVRNIANGTSHRWLANIIPKKYSAVLAHKGKRTINTSAGKGKMYAINSPNGIIYSITNISEFAKQYGLNAGALGEVLRGNVLQHKGWTLPITLNERK
jgi:hypothetical protein